MPSDQQKLVLKEIKFLIQQQNLGITDLINLDILFLKKLSKQIHEILKFFYLVKVSLYLQL